MYEDKEFLFEEKIIKADRSTSVDILPSALFW